MFVVGNAIKEAREKLGMTTEELAKEMGVSILTIETWEKGNPYGGTFPSMTKLANILKISLNELTGNPNYEETQVSILNDEIKKSITGKYIGKISDGYHTFDELYHHRALLFASLCYCHSELFWKAKKHEDGTMYDGMFIVGMRTRFGNATYHYDIDPYWDMFHCEELEHSPIFDGHTPAEAIERIRKECEALRNQ